MFSLQKLLGKNDEFFGLFQRSAEQGITAVEALKKLLKDPSQAAILAEVRSARRESKRTSEEISELLVRTFVTVLEREDIEALANALYRIPKPIEKFAERYAIASEFIKDVPFEIQIKLLETGTSTVARMVTELEKNSNLAKMKALNKRLQENEAEADTLELDLLRDLYRGQTDAMKALIVKDLYDLLELVVDRCRDAGNVMTHIFLKNA